MSLLVLFNGSLNGLADASPPPLDVFPPMTGAVTIGGSGARARLGAGGSGSHIAGGGRGRIGSGGSGGRIGGGGRSGVH